MKIEKKEHLIMLIIGSIMLLIPIFHQHLWFDESYSISIVRHSFKEIYSIASFDVHPILYYFILHSIYLIFGENFIIYRLFSWLCLTINAFLGYTHIRKDINEKVGFCFSFFSLFLPGLMIYSSEIRMYSLGLLLGSLSLIYTYRIYRKNSRYSMLFFGLFSLLLAYTHYYGLLYASLLNVFVFFFLLKKKERKKIKEYLIVAVTEIILYLPWLIHFISQLKSVSRGFWITFSFPRSLVNLISIQFRGSLNYLSAFLFAIIFYVGIITIYRLTKDQNHYQKEIRWCFGLYLTIILSALGCSLVMHTLILLDRYLIIVSSLLVFCFSLIMSKGKGFKLFLCLVFVFSFINLIYYCRDNYSQENSEIIQYIKREFKEGDLLLFKNIIGMNISASIKEEQAYFYNKEHWNIEDAYQAFSPYLKIVNDLSFLKNYHGRIWVIDIEEPIDLINEMHEFLHFTIVSQKKGFSHYKGEIYYIEVINIDNYF